jgi:hypothetical protein
VDDPTTGGGSLAIIGSTGSRTYDLPPACWKAVGAKGFTCKGEACRVSILAKKKARVIKAMCKGDTGDFGPLPEPEALSVVLTIGAGTTRYCGSCGGSPKGNASRVLKRIRCAAPAACP